MSVRPSVIHPFRFRIITSKNQWIFNKLLICTDLWRSNLGLLMAKFVNFWQSYLPATCPYFHFQMTICIAILEIWSGIAYGQILSIFDSYLPGTHPYFHFRIITWMGFSSNLLCQFWRSYLPATCPDFRFRTMTSSKYQWIFTITCYMHWYCRDLGPVVQS